MDEKFRYRVWHPAHGELEVTATSRYWALIEAAKDWGVRWTTIAKDCVITDLGPAPKAKSRKEKRHAKADKKRNGHP